MPVRKIPKNYLVVTGSFPSRKNNRLLNFESLLERDYMILLEFDDSVKSFEEQPVKIPVRVKGRRATNYVPDVLVNFHPGKGGKERKPLLVEVKPRRYLEKHAEKYKPKFAAAKSYATERGWEFRKFIEHDIRSPLLANLKFFREYCQFSPPATETVSVIEAVKLSKGTCTYSALVDYLCGDDTDKRLRTIPIIWHLVATRQLSVDLRKPLTDQAPISLARRRQPL